MNNSLSAFAKPRKQKQKKTQLDTLEQEHMPGISPDDTGGKTFDLDAMDQEPDDTPMNPEDNEFTKNLVDEIDPECLMKLGLWVKQMAEEDESTRNDWAQMIEQGSTLLGLKLEERNTPFRGACSAHHPLLMESAVKFQSKASNELLPSDGPVKIKILGEVTPEREEQGNRVAAHMNYQILEEMTEFYPDSERLLLHVPLFGSAFKKVYYNQTLDRPVSELVTADQLIVPNSAPDLHRAPRFTHILYKTADELNADFDSGMYKQPSDFAPPGELRISNIKEALNQISGMQVAVGESNEGYTLYEQNVVTCIEGVDEDDGDYQIAKPYIITVVADTGEVLAVRRNWDAEDKKRQKKVNLVHFQFVPGFGFYGFGFLHLLGNLQLSLTSSLRSLVDAGQFSNLQGGFKLKGVRIINDGEPIYPGQFKEVDAGVLDINKSIMRLPFGEPSQVLMAMLEFLDGKGQNFADQTDAIVGDATNYGPVGTTLALLDASTKFFSAIHKRLHNSLKQELKLIAAINADTLPDDITYNVEAATMSISRSDYDPTMDIIPVSDPNISSNAHRMAKAQTLLQVAQASGGLIDMREATRQFLAAMDLGNIDKLMPPPETAQPQDPLTDLQAAQQGQPIKAFPGQDHQSHIAIKQAFIGDPNSGANPMMGQVAHAVQANIQEHMLLSFVEQVQAQTQMLMQQQDDQMQSLKDQGGVVPDQIGQDQAMAAAAQQVALLNQQKLQAQMEQQGQDAKSQAALILAQAEMLDSQTKSQKVQVDAKLQAANLVLKNKELEMKSKQHSVDTLMDAKKHDLDRESKANLAKHQAGINAIHTSLQQAHDHKSKMALAKQNKQRPPVDKKPK